MKTYIIDGRPFEFDETKQYLDFYVQGWKRVVTEVLFEQVFDSLQNGQRSLADLQEEFILWDRWNREVVRKRFYRKWLKEGAAVLSGEYWFEDMPDEMAEDYFQKLLNTGELARRFVEVYYPQLAEACKNQQHHPASRHYIDP